MNDRSHETEFQNVKPLIEFYFTHDEPVLAKYTLQMFGIYYIHINILDDKLESNLIVDNSQGRKEILNEFDQQVIDFNAEEMIQQIREDNQLFDYYYKECENVDGWILY